MQPPTPAGAAKNQVETILPGGIAYRHIHSQLSLDDMAAREVDPDTGRPTTLRALFDYWQSQCDGDVSQDAAFDPKGLFTPDEFRWVSWVDVRHSDPMNFVLKSHPGYLFGDWSGKALRDYPNELHARSLAFEYLTCKMIQQPSYFEISQSIGPVSRTYMRLLLPVRGRRQPLARLYYATRYVSISIDGESAIGDVPPQRRKG